MEIISSTYTPTEETKTKKLTTIGLFTIVIKNALIYYHVPDSITMLHLDEEDMRLLYEVISSHMECEAIIMPTTVLTFVRGPMMNDRGLPYKYERADIELEFTVREGKGFYNFNKRRVSKCAGLHLGNDPYLDRYFRL